MVSGDIDEVLDRFSSVRTVESLNPDHIAPYSDSDSDDEEQFEEQSVHETMNRERSESNVIDIIGSLCLQGVYQGFETQSSVRKPMIPDSVLLTANLEKHQSELAELSVMVTRNLEIVPETPFDPNAGKKSPKSKSSGMNVFIMFYYYKHNSSMQSLQ